MIFEAERFKCIPETVIKPSILSPAGVTHLPTLWHLNPAEVADNNTSRWINLLKRAPAVKILAPIKVMRSLDNLIGLIKA